MLRLTAAEAAELQNDPSVRLVQREQLRKLATFRSHEVIGADDMWNLPVGESFPGTTGPYKGEGIVVGIIDTGINYLSNSFKATSDDGYTHVNPLGEGVYLGHCATGANVGHCNSKLIGMWGYDGSNNGRDLEQHGSHVASTAAGGVVNGATYSSFSYDVSGVAPRANIVAYNGCGAGAQGCTDAALVNSINRAVADGIIDVINYSIGGPNDGPWLNSTDLAFLNATESGIVVVAAAGNDGPGETTTDAYAPWYISVASSTPNKFPTAYLLTVDGWNGSATMIPGGAPLPSAAVADRPLIESPTFSDGATDGCAAFPADTFRVGGVDGIAVLRLDQNSSACASGTRRSNAVLAGAAAVLYVDPAYISLGANSTSYSLRDADWQQIKAAVSVDGSVLATISAPQPNLDRAQDQLSGFSSRGPTKWNTLKPDLAAPGDAILAAVSPTATSGYNTANQATTRGLYGSMSGTSMASPHVAGAAALLRQAHPDWSPMEVKSALMMTATPLMTEEDDGPVNPNKIGAGRIDVLMAAKTGFVLDETIQNFVDANPAAGGEPHTLNLASIYHNDCSLTCTFDRTLRSTGTAANWTVTVNGLPVGSYSLDKGAFSLGTSGTEQVSFAFYSTAPGVNPGEWYYGEILFTPDNVDLPVSRFPIAIRAATPSLGVTPLAITRSLRTTDTPLNETVVIANSGNPGLSWSIVDNGDKLRGTIVRRTASGSGHFNFTRATTAQGTTSIETPNTDNRYMADWFDVQSAGSELVSVQVSGFACTAAGGSCGSISVPSTVLHNAIRVWSDTAHGTNVGQPSGRPGKTIPATDLDPVIQWPEAAGGLPNTAPGMSVGDSDIAFDFVAGSVPAAKRTFPAAGRYWINYAPTVTGTSANNGNRFIWAYSSEAPGKTPVAMFSTPNSTTNKTWQVQTEALAMSIELNAVCGAPWMTYDLTADTLSADSEVDVTVTIDASALTIGKHTAYLCVSGNGTSPPSFLGGQDSYLIPVTLNVVENQVPTLDTPFGNRLNAAGVTLTIDLGNHFSDADGDTLSYTVVSGQLPDGLAIVGSQIIGTIDSDAYQQAWEGIQIQAQDGHGGVVLSDVFDWVVLNGSINTPPAALNPIDERTDVERATVSIDLNTVFSDAENDPISYSITAGSLPAGISLNGSFLSGTLSLGAAGTYSGIEITALDQRGMSGTHTFVWNVQSEQRITLSTPSFSFTLPTNGNDDDTLTVSNPGEVGALQWQIVNSPNTLVETLPIGGFTLSGGKEATFTLPGRVNTPGQVVGLKFSGRAVSGLTSSGSWADDLCMRVTSPNGKTFAVGGYDAAAGCPGNGWGFTGSAVGVTYNSTHANAFTPPEDDDGDWTVTFRNDWSGAGSVVWDNVSVTLYKIPSNANCDLLSEVPWLSASPLNGSTNPGTSSGVTVTVNTTNIAKGTDPSATLCVFSNDPTKAANPYSEVPVSLTVVNSAPVVGNQSFDTFVGGSNGATVGTIVATDPDNDTLGFSATGGPGATVFAVSGTGVITIADAATMRTQNSWTLDVSVDDGDAGTSSATVTINLVNNPPVVNNQSFNIASGTPNGTVVGTIVVNDADAGDSYTVAVSGGTGQTVFAVDADGEITVANGAALVPAASFTLDVTVTDSQGATDTATMTITVGNTTPVVDDQSFSVDPGAANGTTVGTIAVTDPDALDTYTVSVTGGTGETVFDVDADGEITVANSAALTLGASFTLNVEVTDSANASDTAVVTITVGNTAPVLNDQPFSVVSGAANGTSIGTISFTDPDDGDSHTFSVTGGTGVDAFAVSADGEITVADSTVLIPAASFTLNVTVTDSLGASDSAVITVTVDNTVPVVAAQSYNVTAGAANGTVVGTIVVTDPDLLDSHTFTLDGGTGADVFAVHSDGEITVTDSSALTPAASFTLEVTATDIAGQSASGTVTITVANSAPVVDDQSFSVSAGQANGSTVGTIAVTDPDAGDSYTVAVTGGSGENVFDVDSAGVITVADSAALVAATSFTLEVTVTDSSGASDSAVVTITVGNIAPVLEEQTFAVSPGAANGTTVGSIAVIDPDAGDSHSFTVTGGSGSSVFNVDADGVITVANSAVLLPGASFTLDVTVTDNLGASDSAVVTVTVGNTAPVVNNQLFDVDVAAANGTVIGTIAVIDMDAGDSYTVTVTDGTGASAFAVSTNGVITVADSTALLASATFTLRVLVTDSAGASDTATITLRVKDLIIFSSGFED